MKKLVLISIFSLPLSFLIIFIIDVVMVSIMGGNATTQGFPIPYYRDVWFTPGIDYSIPLLRFIDFGIIYISITFIGYKLFKNRL